MPSRPELPPPAGTVRLGPGVPVLLAAERPSAQAVLIDGWVCASNATALIKRFSLRHSLRILGYPDVIIPSARVASPALRDGTGQDQADPIVWICRASDWNTVTATGIEPARCLPWPVTHLLVKDEGPPAGVRPR